MYLLVELAVVLVLFTGGLALDLASLQKYVKLTLISGCGQIVIQWSLFVCIGAASGLVSGWSVMFFGLVCSFSSTILVSRVLSERNERQSLHGQIILATLVQQDVLAVLAICILPAFKVTIAADSGHVDEHVDGREIGIVFGVLALVIAILWFLSKYFLGRIVDFFAADGEILVIGTMSYAIGLAGLCAIVSPNSAGLGAFFSGVSLSSLPCKLEMQKKCETIRAFGIVFFFLMVGIDLDVTIESLKEAIPFSILVSALILFVSPVYLTVLGYISGVDARTAWFTGSICNQMSEYGLILGKLANHVGVFDDRTFQVITLSMLLTFFLSSVGHAHADRIFELVRPWLLFMDRHSSFGHLEGEELQWHDHIVLLGFNETGLAVSDFYRHKGKDVLMIEMNYFLVSTISDLRKKEQLEVSKREGMQHENVSPTDVQPVTSRGALALLEHLEAHGVKESESQHIPPSLSVGRVQGSWLMDRPTGSEVTERPPALRTEWGEREEGYVVQRAPCPHSTSLGSLRKILNVMHTKQGDFDTSDHAREESVETERVEAEAKVQDKARRSRMKMDEISKSLQELDDIDARIQQLLTPSRRACHSNSAPWGGAREPGTGIAGALGGMLGGGSRGKVEESTSDDRGHVHAEAAGPAEASRLGGDVEGAGGGSGIGGEGENSVIIVASNFGSGVETREEATDGSPSLNRSESSVLQASHRRSCTRDSERCVRARLRTRAHAPEILNVVCVRTCVHASMLCVCAGTILLLLYARQPLCTSVIIIFPFFFSAFFVLSLFSNSPRSLFSPFCSLFSLLSSIIPPLSCPLSLSALANVWLPVNLIFCLQTRFLFNCISKVTIANDIKRPQYDRFGARRLFTSANRTRHAESRH